MSGRFLKLASWNVNGLRAITGGGKTPLTDLLQQCDHPDVLCLQETRLSSQPDGVAAMKLLGKSVPGYESFWNTCSSRGGYAGVAIFVREGLATAAYDWFPEPCDCAQCAVLRKEGRVMIVELGELVLVNVYVPNGGKEKGSGNGDADELPLKTEFLRQLKCTCETFSKQGRPCIVVGDFNLIASAVDIHYDVSRFARVMMAGEPCINVKMQKWFVDFMADAKLVDSFRALHGADERQYSWWSMKDGSRAENRGWRLDYAMVSELLMPTVRASNVLAHVMGSDHAPVFLELDGFSAPAAIPAAPLPLSSRAWPTQKSISSYFAPVRNVKAVPAPPPPPPAPLAEAVAMPGEAESALKQRKVDTSADE